MKWVEPKKSPKTTVDLIIEKDNKLLLIQRAKEPFKGCLDLIGGFVEYGETAEQAAIREAKEETGLKVKLKEILGVYSNPKRDPRFHTISITFIGESLNKKLESSYEGEVSWFDIKKIDFKKLGFDHAKILKDYLKWKKKKGTYWSTK